MSKTTLKITGMMCEKCMGTVSEALSSVDGVTKVDVDLKKGTAVVEHNGVPDEKLVMAVLDLGFKAKVKHGLF